MIGVYRRPSRRKNTIGRYKVGAKTEKEAEELVRAAIGFGFVKFYYWERKDSPCSKVKYREVVKEVPNSRLVDATYSYEKPRHACDTLT